MAFRGSEANGVGKALGKVFAIASKQVLFYFRWLSDGEVLVF
jgi:hypothetical protein